MQDKTPYEFNARSSVTNIFNEIIFSLSFALLFRVLPGRTAVVSSPVAAVLSPVGKRNKSKIKVSFIKQTIYFEVKLYFSVGLDCIVKELMRENKHS